jgi:nucleoside-diphosphate-sugar epimerase
MKLAQLINEITENPGGLIVEEAKRIEDDPQTRRPDISKARESLQWEPTIDIRDGLERTIAYFRESMSEASV